MTLVLPTLEKTGSSAWQFANNLVTAASGTLLTDAQNMLFGLKQALIGFTHDPWTVISSSDSVSTTSSDLWTDASKLIWNTDPYYEHSWIVLQQTRLGGTGTSQICINLYNSANQISITFSPTVGFSGGTLLTRPTATDEAALLNNTWINSTSQGGVIHVQQSGDGQSTRFFVFQAGSLVSWLLLETVVTDASSLLTYKGLAWCSTSLPTLSYLTTTAGWMGTFGSVALIAYTGSESYSSTYVASAMSGVAPELTGGYPLCPISAHSETTGATGRVGRFVDMWFGSPSIVTGSTYPASGARNFIQIGGLVLPWDGTSEPLITA